MSTIAENLQKLVDDRDNIAEAIAGKGVEVPENSKLSEFPEMINSISGGGASGVWMLDNGLKYDHFKEWVNISEFSVEMPYAPCDAACVVLNGEIHLMGGANTSEKINGTIKTGIVNSKKHYIFNGKEWRNAGDLPEDMTIPNAVVHDNVLHLFNKRSHYKYINEEWVACSDLPIASSYKQIVIYNNAIHFFASNNGIVPYKYISESDTWEQTDGGQTLTGYYNVTEFNGDLFAFAQTGSDTSRRCIIYKYDPEALSWKNVFDDNTTYATINNNITFVYNNELYVRYYKRYNLLNSLFKWNGNRFSSTDFVAPAYPRGVSVPEYNNSCILMGGYQGSTSQVDADYYFPKFMGIKLNDY